MPHWLYFRVIVFALVAASGAVYGQGVGDADLVNAGTTDSGANWLTYGRDYAETRYSPLRQINTGNVAGLGVAWMLDTGTHRGLEATPLVADGVLYATRPWSSVFAVDARTGELLWDYDPAVDRSAGWKACCDVVNRGVALYEGKVFAGILDGRLIALDAASGDLLWEVQTTDPAQPYTITGAPRVASGHVIIGNGGAELGSRGYVTAYDAETGEQRWRFWVVPGNPEDGFENPDVERAAATWNGNWWEVGGGGNSWDAIAYDPDAGLVYIGTGNGSPWSHEIRSDGIGDNLYLSSIVALDVETGRVAWHYQTTPGDNWDYTATQQLTLAELEIDGATRKVILQAPKNGFFYVLDRLTGELLSADPYIRVTWASGVDPATGRPIETPQARYSNAVSIVSPGPVGGHNWHPMSFNPETGLVYIPVQENSFSYATETGFRPRRGTWNRGIATGDVSALPQLPEADYRAGTGPESPSTGALLAWDPVARTVRWRADYDTHSNGGTLTTAGNLVFHGTAAGHLLAYRADTGETLWDVDLGQGILAPPVTYLVDGEQYLSVLVGWGGTTSLFGYNASGEYKAPGRLWTFALGGDQNTIPVRGLGMPPLTPIDYDDSPAAIARGADLYARYCVMCHGGGASSGGAIADLRHASEATFGLFDEIVRGDVYAGLGMPNLSGVVTEREVVAIRNYLLSLRAALIDE
ncbi:MAG: PQQ-dependent dehydrogenase, methanol/ethanol family [Gammaproteobacteria bacterium]|jgi:quinohemoprotein ethanol dehydrogenase